jgi:glycosyltransferase involved in cell wall biosynthesis
MAAGLAQQGMRVTLLASIDSEQTVEGVRIVPTRLRGKASRLLGAPTLLPRLKRIDADIYHFHDPELLPWMFLYQMMNPSIRVIYDVHEYFPEALLVTDFFRVPVVNRIMSRVVEHVEPLLARRLSGVIGVTEPIAKRFEGARAQVAVVRNVVRLASIEPVSRPSDATASARIVLGGSINAARCMEELIAAIAILKARGIRLELLCVGKASPPSFADLLKGRAESLGVADQMQMIDKLPFLDYQRLVGGSSIGVVLYAPGANNEMGVPNRLYEFMAHRLAIVATDFPEVAKIVRSTECGVLIDSAAPGLLADGIEYLLSHQDEAAEMGMRGRRAIETTYCWEREIQVLLQFYRRVIDGNDQQNVA